MKRIGVTHISAVIAAFAACPASAQFRCDEPTSNEWLRQAPGSETAEQVSPNHVRPVVDAIDEAIALLVERSAVPITGDQVQQFTGAAAPTSDKRLHAYLLRAVFPTNKPTLDIRWDGTMLEVFAAGLGCAPFVKHPIVVFLDRRPEQVFVMASTAL